MQQRRHKHEIKYCPRCQNPFECKVSNIMHCQCMHVELSKETSVYLESTEYDCLCRSCLVELNQLIEKCKQLTFPRQSEGFVEGVHYYLEGENWVFTELYHLLRGNCCRSGCRHCAYGFKKITES
ncbi:MAG: cysteine-rich CWC family protein [Bacteroidota bacterium]